MNTRNGQSDDACQIRRLLSDLKATARLLNDGMDAVAQLRHARFLLREIAEIEDTREARYERDEAERRFIDRVAG